MSKAIQIPGFCFPCATRSSRAGRVDRSTPPPPGFSQVFLELAG